MKKNQLVTLGVVALFLAAIVGVNAFQPSRISEQRMKEQEEAKRQLEGESPKFTEKLRDRFDDAAKLAAEKTTVASTTAAASSADAFQVEFQCSNGTFIVEVYPEWAPLGAEQFKQIIEAGIYNE